MLIYKDKISGDELLTDAYGLPEEICDGAIYKVKGKLTTETTDIDDSAIGGNASAEGPGDEGGDACVVSGINICIANRLVQSGFEKKSYKVYIKDYMKAILETLPDDEKKCFQKGCSTFVKTILEDFKNFEFWQGEAMNAEAMFPLVRWEEDDSGNEHPYVYYFKHGLEEEKA